LLGVDEPAFLVDLVAFEPEQNGQLRVRDLLGLPLDDRDDLALAFDP